MKKTLFLDAAFIIALLDTSDAYHGKAKAWRKRLRAEQHRLVTTWAVLFEAGDGFGKRGYWPRFRPVLEWVLTNPLAEVLPLTAELAKAARDLQDGRRDKRWGLTDCASFVVMQERGLTEALTSDEDFVQAGFRALLREE
jgi:hypothetical protein